MQALKVFAAKDLNAIYLKVVNKEVNYIYVINIANI